MKINEYVVVKNKHNHPELEKTNCYEWDGDLAYMDEVHRMFNEVFRLNRLSTEMSYVVAFDHKKHPKGVCQIGHGDANQTSTSMQNIFTFLMLAGANSFVVAHNHVSNMPEASIEDKLVTTRITTLANMFDIEFVGHMIINPMGYVIDGGLMDGCTSSTDDDLTEDDDSALPIEYLGNGRAATYVFGNRIEGTIEEIEQIIR